VGDGEGDEFAAVPVFLIVSFVRLWIRSVGTVDDDLPVTGIISISVHERDFNPAVQQES
jgi:hypothetical protein